MRRTGRSAPRQLCLPIDLAPAPGRPGGRELENQREVEFREMTCRSILTWVDGARAADFFSVNPYRGCEFGCVYCYARYTHEFLDHASSDDFERIVYVKVNAPQVLARELKRKNVLEHGLGLSSATDPYQPAERRFMLTQRLLETLLPYRGLSLSVITKSALVERDAPLLAELARRHEVKVLLSCITVDPALQRALEPRAPTPERRMAALARLSGMGIDTGLILAPILPGLTDSFEQLRATLERARAAGARSVTSQVLFLPTATRPRFLSFLSAFRPALVPHYQEAFRAGRDTPPALRERIEARLERALAAAGFRAEQACEVRGQSS